MFSRRIILRVLPLLIAAIAIGFLSRHSTASSAYRITKDETNDTKGLDAQFKYEIERFGDMAAYQRFGEAVSDLPPDEQHTMAHLFGSALFDSEGDEAIRVCDQRFALGCYHEILIHTLLEHGMSYVKNLNDICSGLGKDALTCQHGLGHGILSYFGDEKGVIKENGYLTYTTDALKKSLDVCSTLPNADPIIGCRGGVFMEFSMHKIMAAEGNPGYLHQGQHSIDYPCTELGPESLKSCYFWQPLWWFIIAINPHSGSPTLSPLQAFSRIGTLCEGVPSEYVDICFDGAGNVLPGFVEYDPQQTRTMCEALSADGNRQLACKRTAAEVFSLAPDMKDKTRIICQSAVSGRVLDNCLLGQSSTSRASPVDMKSSELHP